MKEYELTVVFSPEIPEEEIGNEVERVGQLVTQRGGEITGDINRWGRRKLAYPIRRFREGNYILAHFKMEPGKTRDLETNLEKNEGILRHLLVRLDD